MPATLVHPRVLQIAAPFEGGAIVNCYLIDAPKRAIIGNLPPGLSAM